jgi:DNA anti-recombination protein RmuC
VRKERSHAAEGETSSPGGSENAEGADRGDASVYTDLTKTMVAAFAGPLQAVADAIAEPWRELGDSLATSWAGVATAVSENYRNMLSTQIQQVMALYQPKLEEILKTTTANLPEAISELQQAATSAQLSNSAEIDKALETVRRQAEEANAQLVQQLDEIRRTLIDQRSDTEASTSDKGVT